MEQNRGLRLVLVPLPLQGHINPMLQLANILHSKGFSITIIHTTFNSPNPSNYPQFTFCCIQDGLSDQSESSTLDLLHLVNQLNIRCVTPFKEMLGTLLSDANSEEPIACLITDALFYFTQDVADTFKLPRIVLRTTGASSFIPFVAFPLLIGRGYLPIQESQLEEAVTELPPLKVKDLPMIDTREPQKFFKEIFSLVKETKASSGLIWNTFEELESSALASLRKEFPIPFFPIGPFHKYFPSGSNPSSSSSLLTQDHSCISWLDKHKHKPNSVVYVSFGSLAAINETQFLEIAWGLANSKVPFLWVVRPGLILGSEWLEPLPSGFVENLEAGRGHIVKWAPQQEVLAHPAVGAFWTHSGWNSTLESICEGVPMICMPCFTDQKVNARHVSHVWKVGVQFERGAERGEIVKMIRRVMEEKEGMEIRERMLSLKEKVELCWRQGGSSYSSLDGLVNYILSLGEPVTLAAP